MSTAPNDRTKILRRLILMVAPALSQHVKHDLVRHWWSCESCGHEFHTTVRLPTLPTEVLQQQAMA